MILFSERKKILRDTVLEYLKNKLDEKHSFQLKGLFENFDNNGEEQMCQIRHIETDGASYSLFHEGTLNDSMDDCPIESASTDLLCNIADQVHLKMMDTKFPQN